MKSDSSTGTEKKPPLAQRVTRAGGWMLFGYGTSQLIRFGGNLILTRLLFPEAFGLMAIVQAVITGVAMLSDVGISQSIIYDKRGHDPAFVNTAWTMQVIRGALMWLVICLLAIPFASLYSEPMLVQLLPAVGLTAVLTGFTSTKIALAERDLGIARVTMLDLGSATIGMVATIALAWIDRSVWALVIGNIIGAAVRMVASHILLGGVTNRFEWQRESLNAVFTFGRWIFVSSALSFLVGEGSRLLVGKLLDIRMLAFFTLAMAIDQFARHIVVQIGGRVLFPAYAEVVRERPERLHTIIAKSRLAQIVPYWLVCVCFVYFGPALMTFLYDERYHDSGWMLQILALGSLAGSVWVSYSAILWAKGLVRTSTMLLAIQLLVQVTAMLIGSYFAGAKGLVLGLASASWIVYPVYALVFARLLLWQPKIDLPFIALSILIVGSILST